MAVVVRGNFGKLKGWREALKKAPELMVPISKDGAEELLGKVQDGFRAQADPYGAPWAPKKFDDGRAILVGKTTRLRRGWHVKAATRKRFVISPSVDYAAAHQDPRPRPKWGGKKLPRRAMVPYRGLPKAWADSMREVVREHMREHFLKSSSSSRAGMSIVQAKLAGMKRKFNAIALIKRAVRKVQGD
jgi:phage gpG-like protein